MTKVLITGATGNVGMAVLTALEGQDHNLSLFAGVRDTKNQDEKLARFSAKKVNFDFTDLETFPTALKEIDLLFLLRPPQISDVQRYFAPLIQKAKEASVKHIVFLSVQGVEKSKIIPHHKIEKLIVESEISYTFLRPAYFMQNFTTTLRSDLVNKQRIYLPAGRSIFTLIDVDDVGAVAAKVITSPALHVNTCYALTNSEKLTFGEMADKLSRGLDRKIDFVSPNLLQFFFTKKKEGVPAMFIFVMILLHYFPRFQDSPETTECVKQITERRAKTFDEFILENKDVLLKYKAETFG